MFRHSKKLLLVLALVLGLVIGFGTVSADEPTEESVLVVAYEDVVSVLGGDVRTDCPETAIATDEDGTPACEEWCSSMNCVFPVTSSRVLPANEPIRWWAGCKCVTFEGPPYTACVCYEQSFCGRTRNADFVGWTYNGRQFYPGGFVGTYNGANNLTIARFRLAGIPTGEIEKVIVSLDGVQPGGLEGCGDAAAFRIDLLSYALSYTWQDWWGSPQLSYATLDTIYEISTQYLNVVTDEDGRVPTLGFRFSEEHVSGLEEAIARAQYGHRSWHPNWSLFIRVSLVNPPPGGDCVLKFQNALLTVIPE